MGIEFTDIKAYVNISHLHCLTNLLLQQSNSKGINHSRPAFPHRLVSERTPVRLRYTNSTQIPQLTTPILILSLSPICSESCLSRLLFPRPLPPRCLLFGSSPSRLSFESSLSRLSFERILSRSGFLGRLLLGDSSASLF